VLVRPFDCELGTFVEAHRGSVAVSSFCVILGVEQAIRVVSVGVRFVETIVATSWVLHVQVGESASREKYKYTENFR
jgi:hypothetical protein